MSSIIFNAPRSGYAQSNLGRNYNKNFLIVTLISIFGLFAGIVSTVFSFLVPAEQDGGLSGVLASMAIFIGVSLVIWILALLFRYRRWKRTRISILEFNENDFRLSQKLQKVLNRFATALSTDFPVTESLIKQTWRAFRVEHFVSDFIRGRIEGSINLSGFIFSFGGNFTGTIKGRAIPNLLDTSTMVFLQSEAEKTLRLIIPSPRATRELLTMIIEHFLGDCDREYKRNLTHTQMELDGFSMNDARLIEPISHPDVIDSLDLAKTKPFTERPQVKVAGEQVQPGIVLVTTLEVNGEKKIFLPTGLFRALTTDISNALETKTDQIPASAVLAEAAD